MAENPVIFESTPVCPACHTTTVERMPTDECQFYPIQQRARCSCAES